jgi:hypothetical protein
MVRADHHAKPLPAAAAIVVALTLLSLATGLLPRTADTGVRRVFGVERRLFAALDAEPAREPLPPLQTARRGPPAPV